MPIIKSTFDNREYIQHNIQSRGTMNKIECLTHNICYYISNYDLKVKSQSRGCKLCGNEIRSAKTTKHNMNNPSNRRYSKHELINIISNRLSDEYILNTPITNDMTYSSIVNVHCIKHNVDFDVTINNINVSSGRGCKQCANFNKMKNRTNGGIVSLSEFKSRLLSKNTSVTIIDRTFKGMRIPAKFKCKVHGEFEQKTVNVLASKFGCKDCAKMLRDGKSVPYDEVISRCKKIHSDSNGNPLYTYVDTESEYSNLSSELTVVCPIHGTFTVVADYHINNKNGCPKCRTKTQTKITEWLESLGITIISNYRIGLGIHEVDLYMPDFNLAIEYHGVLWHSYGTTYPNNFDTINRNIDKNKYNYLRDNNIQLMTIWDIEFDKNEELWKSMILSKLNLIPKDNIIYARKCDIRQVSSADARVFLERNHMQGNNYAKYNIGLYYNDELVSLMTFKKDITKRADYELVRFCNIINHIVIGAASKLLKSFENSHNVNSIISYANKRWSDGKLYSVLNFEYVKDTDPSYFYFNSKEYKLYSRNGFQKHMLKDKLKAYDENKSELANMICNDYRVIYDAGNITYIKKMHE